jgi:aminopeptidase N
MVTSTLRVARAVVPTGLALMALVLAAVAISGQELDAQTFTGADTLRGTVTPERAWWDVRRYDLRVAVNPADSTIRGSNTITYEVVAAPTRMQIDLQVPLVIHRVAQAGRELAVERDGNAWFVQMPDDLETGERHELTVEYHGTPRVAPDPPWDGGFVWARDPAGGTWVATANQGLGASVWWPNKDHQSEEPEEGMTVAVRVPEGMTNISNGRLVGSEPHPDGSTTWTWAVENPINNYNVTINAGDYVHFGETFRGLAGTLDLDYWVLRPHLEAARRQFVQVRPMLACFEDWFGPYPFYEDGFKLVETPHLGMEHQSAIAYGNGFQNGYLGRDLSGTGWGLTWDFIIVHEAGHEWFGNNLTTADVADMWVHEGFANYSESLYVECLYGTEAGAEYVIGTRDGIRNDRPLIGAYGVQHEGSGDMYSKGGNLLHTLRQLVDDDALWKNILRGLNRDFRHSIVTSAEVEDYIAERAGLELDAVFDQYLRRTRIPTLEWRLRGERLEYRWDADVDGFAMPVRITVGGGRFGWIVPTTGRWRATSVTLAGAEAFAVDDDFHVESRRVGG